MTPRTRKSDEPVLPPDYTFAPNGILIHQASFERLQKLTRETNKRDSSTSAMHIYEDYFGDAILDLLDSTLSTIHTHVIKKRWLEAWHILDAFSKYVDVHGEWINIDDGDRVSATEKARGALLVKTIRALDATGQLNEQVIPDLDITLRDMTEWSEYWGDTLDTCYHEVLKGYGKKLFGNRTDEEWARIAEARRRAYNAFVRRLSPKERPEKGYHLLEDDGKSQKNEKNGREEEKKWYEDGDIKDINMKDSSLYLSPVWKEYKEYLRFDSDSEGEWDLTQWTEEERRPYKLGLGSHGPDDYDD